MSENIKKEEVAVEAPDTQEEVTETNDTVEVNDIKVDEPLHWEGLVQERTSLVRTIMEQQALVLELAKKYQKELANDPETGEALNGLMLSIQDLAKNVAEISTEHTDENGNFKTGLAETDEDILLYLKVGSTYVSIEENLANLIATAYLDVFTRLTSNSMILDEMKDIKGELDARKPE